MVGKTSGTGKRKREKKHCIKIFGWRVRKSRARFISIFCIVALGVAFFSGYSGGISGYEIYRVMRITIHQN